MSMKNGVWHDVQLDPPAVEGSYLVATDKGGVFISHWYPRRMFNGIETGGCFGGRRVKITHWMPRPLPPRNQKPKAEYVFRSRMKPENRERSKQIWALKQNGVPLREIARRYGIATSTVYQILKAHERMLRHGQI